MITQRPKGTQDWYGPDMYKRTVIEEIARKLCRAYHIKEIITPVFEHTILFQRGVGETTDVVQKEMYTFKDKGNRSITLKPEGTAGAVRAYLENSLYAESQPTKLFYITQAFRYENPQSGRLRQHHQFGVEIFGSASPLAEIEIISLLTEFMKELGLKGVNLYINSIGCKNCRKIYNEVLLDFLKKHEHELCGTCKERMQKNPLRTLDCKVPSCHEIMKNAPRTIDYLDEECKEHFEELKSLLNEMNIAYKEDSGIVRGLDYYTKTVFEFINSEGLTLCGGGRYDNLINEIDGKLDIPAVGFGFGIERIIKELDAEGIELAAEPSVDLYVGILGKESKAAAYRLVKSLRQAGLIVETDYMDRSIKAQMKYANKIGARYTVIIGADELAAGKANIKNMDTGNQVEVDIDKINDFITICE
ncbi:MAG TPA: histidine--tRNA ligase [Clostridiales bacterium]|jgi:histidyl-tRNA synthetase|nr:histidine--tRNA ligase [Clostridiales bacterium]